MHKKQFHHMHATVIIEQYTTEPISGGNMPYRHVRICFISYRTLMFDIDEVYRVDRPLKPIQRFIIVSPYISYSPTTKRQVSRFLQEYGYEKSVSRFLKSGKAEFYDVVSKTKFRYGDIKNALSDFQFNYFKSSEVY